MLAPCAPSTATRAISSSVPQAIVSEMANFTPTHGSMNITSRRTEPVSVTGGRKNEPV